MKQYWMKVKYNGTARCTNPLWELTQGRYRSEIAVRNAYKARARVLDFEILEVKERGIK